jgi:hypothetical protein
MSMKSDVVAATSATTVPFCRRYKANLPAMRLPEGFVFPQRDLPCVENTPSITPEPATNAVPSATATAKSLDHWIEVTLSKVQPCRDSRGSAEGIKCVIVPDKVLAAAKITSMRPDDRFEARCRSTGDDSAEAIEIRRI